jgi:hypothetical protein
LNWVMRRSSPKLVAALRSHAASACAVTWLCAKTVERSGWRPVAKSIAAPASVYSRSCAGSIGVVIECRSTMQKNASPSSCVAAYCR